MAHFVVVIDVTKVTPVLQGSQGSKAEIGERKKEEISKIIVKARTLEGAIKKASQHLDLIDEEDQDWS